MLFKELLDKILSEGMNIDNLSQYKNLFIEYSRKVLSGKINPADEELYAFLRLCLDFYTYSTTGEVLIPDSIYDQCMQYYKSSGKENFFYADSLGKKWEFVKHDIPGMVGTLDKIYSYPELKKYLSDYLGVEEFILAPKYDGISCCIHVKNHKIFSAATRYDGVNGQNITQLIMRAKNANWFTDTEQRDGYYKCELCVSTKDFNELATEKKYANRRSATTGIVNTPSNLHYAKYISIIPLLYYDGYTPLYIAPAHYRVSYYSPADLMDEIAKLLEKIRSKDFPYRVDGVVIYPILRGQNVNELDLMDTSIAYKVNTAEGKTRIKYGYMSVGRLGNCVPMLKVEPVEVNETIVEDVSLGSYDKFLSMNLLENEEIVVYSAGDVIPQVKLPEIRNNFENAEPLRISKYCPYCGERFERVNTEYACINPNCIRVVTGKISNFMLKMGINGFSDKTVESLYSGLNIRTIPEFLNLSPEKIKSVDGFDTTSSNELYNEICRIRTTPCPISRFFGALGIDKISEKKCRLIFEFVSLDELLNLKKFKKLYWKLQNANGVGTKTADAFLTFIKDNIDMIVEVVPMMTLTQDNKYVDNIVFTGFRDESLANQFRELGIEVSDSVTTNTIAVLTASLEKESTKMKSAKKKGIPVYHYSAASELLGNIMSRE